MKNRAKFHFLRIVGLLVLLLGSTVLQISYAQDTPIELPDGFDIEGHRGARGLKPENTLPAFETALDLGVTTLELDLHFTADEVVVIWHDDVIESDKCRLDPDTAIDVPDPDESPFISQLTFEQIQAYRCDRNPVPDQFPDQNHEATALAGDNYHMLSLEALFDFVEMYAESEDKSEAQRENAQRVQFNIETKRKPDNPQAINDGFDGVNAGAFELAILELVEKRNLVDRVIIQSFDHRSLWAVRAENESIRLAVLTFGTRPPLADFATYDVAIWSPYYGDLTPDLMRTINISPRLKDVQLIPWTVNDECTARSLIDQGVDGIISDFPDMLLNLRGESGETESTAATKAEDNIERNKEQRRRYIEDGQNGGNVDIVGEVFACDVVGHWIPSAFPTPVGIAEYRQIITDFVASYADFEATIEVMIAEDDWVASREIWRGSLNGTSFELEFNSLSHFNDEGKIVEEWLAWDHLGYLQQLNLPIPE